jgi:hypothetical protein
MTLLILPGAGAGTGTGTGTGTGMLGVHTIQGTYPVALSSNNSRFYL